MEIMNGAKKDLPNATVVLVLGILSLIFCWCYGFFGLILGIIAVVLAGQAGCAGLFPSALRGLWSWYYF